MGSAKSKRRPLGETPNLSARPVHGGRPVTTPPPSQRPSVSAPRRRSGAGDGEAGKSSTSRQSAAAGSASASAGSTSEWVKQLTSNAKRSDVYAYLPAPSAECLQVRIVDAEPQPEPGEAPPGHVLEYVICDTRLEYPELIQVDQPIEVLFTGDEGMAAFPLSGCAPSGALGGGHMEERASERFVVTWERGDDGWMVLPPYGTYRAEEGEHLGSGWYGDLRYSVHQDVRAKVKWTQFSSGYFRTFVLPLPGDNAARVLVTTNSEVYKRDRFAQEHPTECVILAHHMLTPQPGEWMSTRRALAHDAAGEAREAQDQASLEELILGERSSTADPLRESQGLQQFTRGDSDGEHSLSASCTLSASCDQMMPNEVGQLLLRSSAENGELLELEQDLLRSSGAELGRTSLPLFPHQLRTVEWMEQVEASDDEMDLPQLRRFYDHYVFHHGLEKSSLGKKQEVVNVQLPRGGLVAHSVGAGKTVICISLIACQPCHTVVVVPDHIVSQWVKEFQRFAPQLSVEALTRPSSSTGVDVLIVPYGQLAVKQTSSGPAFRSRAARDALSLESIGRIVFDEPQEIVHEPFFEVLIRVRARYRWGLTATPYPNLDKIMQLCWGAEFEHPFDRMLLSHFIRHRARRDPPGDCLPVPALHVHMVPVTLTWKEMTEVHLHAMRSDLQETIQRCSFQQTSREGRAELPERPKERHISELDGWISERKRPHEVAIQELDTRISEMRAEMTRIAREHRHAMIKQWESDAKERRADQERRAEIEAMERSKHRSVDEWLLGDETKPVHTDDVTDFKRVDELRAMDKPRWMQKRTDQAWEAAREKMISAALGRIRARQEQRYRDMFAESVSQGPNTMFTDEQTSQPAETNSELNRLCKERATRQRMLSFLQSVEATLNDKESECAVCMDLLRDKIITVLPCFHAFCAGCVVQLFGRSQKAVCPMCRASCLKKLLCTFVCNKEITTGQSTASAEARFGTKMSELVQTTLSILAGSDDEKILVFAQWDGLLRRLHRALLDRSVDSVILSNDMGQRCEQIRQFQEEAEHRVMLLSYQHQSSGINLHAANHVFIVHPYCNAGVQSADMVPLVEAQQFERQAVGRVHRYPQKRDVHVYRFFAKGSVEEDLYAQWGWA